MGQRTAPVRRRSPDEIDDRLDEPEREWDIERTLEALRDAQ